MSGSRRERAGESQARVRIGETAVNRPALNPWFWLCPSFLVFWILGIGFMWWSVVPTLWWLSIWLRNRRAPFGFGSILLVSLGCWLLVSLILGVIDGTVESGGAAGAVFSALVWVSAGLLYSVINATPVANRLVVLRGVILLGAIQGFLTVVAVGLHPSPLDSVSLPAQGVLGGISSIAPWTSANLAYSSYFGDQVTRSAGVMGTAAWSGGFAMVVLLLMLATYKQLVGNGMRRAWWWFAFVCLALSVYFSYSRLSLAIVVCLGGFFVLRLLAVRVLPRGGTAVAVYVTAAFLVVSVFTVPWQEYLNEQDALRPGSSETRLSSYVSAVDAVVNSGISSVIGGLGDKPTFQNSAFGIGSESTLFSLLVRGGMIAVTLFLAFLLVRLFRSMRDRNLGMCLVLCGLGVHAVAADLDVGTLTLVAAFLNVDSGLSRSGQRGCREAF